MQLKIGELAKRSGVSVRTLHHYHEIGLLSPSLRTESGHRLYSDKDVLRLQQIISLRSLKLSLEQIAEFLRTQQYSPLRVLEMHLEKLQQEAEERNKLISNLQGIAETLRSGENPTVDELLNLIEGMTMFEKYYSTEQLGKLQERRTMLGEDKIREVENEWVVLIQEVKTEMNNGSMPNSQAVQKLARRWQGLLDLFTGGDPGIAASCSMMYQEEGPAKASRGALDTEVFEFMGKALAELDPQQNNE
jgi:DNA-binding transcriptional MerR regulator